MDNITSLILFGGLFGIAMWANTMMNWRSAVWLLLWWTPFMGLSVVVAHNVGGGSALALLSRDVLIVAPLYVALFLFTRNQPYHRVPWHVTAAYAVFSFIVLACCANPKIPNPLVAIIGTKVWIGYMPLMFVGAVFLRSEKDLLGVLRAMVAMAWIPWVVGIVQYIGALTIGFEETMTFFFGDYASLATGRFSCFDFGAPLCRIPGTFQFNSQYGVFCTFMLFPLFMLLAVEQNKGWRGFAAMSVAVGFIAGFTSGARGNLILMPLCVMMIYFFRFRMKGGMQVMMGLGGAAFVVFNLMGIDADKAYGTAGKLGAEYGRDLVVGGFADGVAKGGLFGQGTGTNTGPARHAFEDTSQMQAEYGYYIENFMAKTLAELGILGFFALLFCFLIVGLHLLQGQFSCRDQRLKDATATITAMVAFTAATSVKGWALDVDPLNFYYFLLVGFGFAIPHIDRATQVAAAHAQAGGYSVDQAQAASAARYAYQGRYGRVRSAQPKFDERGGYGYGGRYGYGRYGGRPRDAR
jgi:hypothetical protein